MRVKIFCKLELHELVLNIFELFDAETLIFGFNG